MTKHTFYLYPQSSKEHSAPPSDSQRYQEKLSSVESIIREMMEETQGLGKHYKVQFRITSPSFITLSHMSMIPEKKQVMQFIYILVTSGHDDHKTLSL